MTDQNKQLPIVADTRAVNIRETDKYIADRIDNQISYFDTNAIKNQKIYRRFKSSAIWSNVLTTLAIAIVLNIPDSWTLAWTLSTLVLSTWVLFTYQWEEFHNHGAKWEKFRLVAEQLKSEKFLYINGAGRYKGMSDSEAHERLVETVENIIKGTDISYFSLMVDPGRRIEKRLEHSGEN